jgi:hypothetical protein
VRTCVEHKQRDANGRLSQGRSASSAASKSLGAARSRRTRATSGRSGLRQRGTARARRHPPRNTGSRHGYTATSRTRHSTGGVQCRRQRLWLCAPASVERKAVDSTTRTHGSAGSARAQPADRPVRHRRFEHYSQNQTEYVLTGSTGSTVPQPYRKIEFATPRAHRRDRGLRVP